MFKKGIELNYLPTFTTGTAYLCMIVLTSGLNDIVVVLELPSITSDCVTVHDVSAKTPTINAKVRY